MTKVTLRKEDERKFYLSCDGHATGREDVCAVISALVQTVSSWGICAEKVSCRSKIVSGKAEVWWSGFGKDGGVMAETAFSLLETAFRKLEATAPDVVCVTVR